MIINSSNIKVGNIFFKKADICFYAKILSVDKIGAKVELLTNYSDKYRIGYSWFVDFTTFNNSANKISFITNETEILGNFENFIKIVSI